VFDSRFSIRARHAVLIAACAMLLITAPTFAGETSGTAPWFDAAWPWRQVVRVDQPDLLSKYPTGAVTIEVGGPAGAPAKADGADIRVATADARLMPHVVTKADGGGVSVRFKLAPNQPAEYFIYYGNPDAAPAAAATLPGSPGGIHLEVREYTDGVAESGVSRRSRRKPSSPGIATLDAFRKAYDAAATRVIGSGPRQQIYDRANPFSKELRTCLALYEGTIRAPVSGDYGFQMKATGAAFLVIDGTVRASQTRALGQFTASAPLFLEQGDHTIALHVFSRHPVSYIAQLQWRPPGQDNYAPAPPSAFPTDAGFSVTGLQRFGQPLNAWFTTGVTGQVRLMRTDTVLSAVRFRDLTSSSLGDIAMRTWDFGDGCISTDASPEHTYRKPGTYTVILTARDTLGFEHTCSRTLTLDARVSRKMELVFTQQQTHTIVRGDAGNTPGGDASVPLRLDLKLLSEQRADLLVEQRLEWRTHTITLFSKRFDELMSAKQPPFQTPVVLPGLDATRMATYRIADTARSRLERAVAIEAMLPNLPGQFAVTTIVYYGQIEIGRKRVRVLLDTEPFPELASWDPNLVDAGGCHLIIKTTGGSEFERTSLATLLGDQTGPVRVALVDNSLCPGGAGYDEASLFFGVLRRRLEKHFDGREVTIRRLAVERDTLGHFPVKRLIETGAAIERFQPHVIVVSLDQQDMSANTPIETVRTYLDLLVNHFAAHSRAKIVLVTPPPMPFATARSKVFALALGRFALERNIEVADVYEAVNLHEGDWKSLFLDDTLADGATESSVYMMYMNTTGQRLIADTIFKAMLKE